MKMKLFFLIILLSLLTIVSNGQSISNKPILRIENGSHISKLTEISTDAANRYIVTASDDKTARVWDLASGKLISVLRPPIGDDKEGLLYAVSISPDGNTIAIGGWTGRQEARNCSIYIFDRESGKIQKRIQGLSSVIFNLTYSADGKYLGATLAEKGGMRLYETSNYQIVGEDLSYDEASEWIDFDPTSTRIVTSSFDGYLRLYEINNGKLRLLNKSTLKTGKQPIGVKFSPNGASIAVGFYNTTGVAVVSATDLSVLYEVDVSKISKRTTANPTYFPVISWSVDGETLYAAGTYYNDKGEFLICEWKDNGQSYKEMVASKGAIFDIDALQDGRIIFGVANPPAWGILDKSGKQLSYVESNLMDFRRNPKGILVNEDGSKIQFPYEPLDAKPALFSLLERSIDIGKINAQNLKSSLLKASELNILKWNSGQQPTLNGNALNLQPYERSYSLSILPNNQSFLIGTNWYLRLFDNKGNQLWRVSVPDSTWHINNSENGKVAVAALADGTIRWYRISDGQELLSFFSPNDDTGRWILWTPSGYYDASPNAEDLIGWHVNNSLDAASDFFPNHLFRGYFYRPDVIDRILQTTDEGQALKLVNEKAGRDNEQLSIAKVLPPVIQINSPKINDVSETTVKINYTMRNHSGEPLTSLKALIDGREINLSVSTKKSTNEPSEVTLQIPKKNSELTLIAENRFTKGVPVKINFRWKGQ